MDKNKSQKYNVGDVLDKVCVCLQPWLQWFAVAIELMGFLYIKMSQAAFCIIFFFLLAVSLSHSPNVSPNSGLGRIALAHLVLEIVLYVVMLTQC